MASASCEKRRNSMAVTIPAIIRCDRCEREQTVVLSENSHGPEFHHRLSGILDEANRQGRFGWALLDQEGRKVYDRSLGAVRLLCAPCADEYRRFVERRNASEDEFMHGAWRKA